MLTDRNSRLLGLHSSEILDLKWSKAQQSWHKQKVSQAKSSISEIIEKDLSAPLNSSEKKVVGRNDLMKELRKSQIIKENVLLVSNMTNIIRKERRVGSHSFMEDKYDPVSHSFHDSRHFKQ